MTRASVRSADGAVSGWLFADDADPDTPLLVCIHGGGCNGQYFDLKGCSTLAAARARGFGVLLVNRPGYAGNPIPPSASPVAASVPLIRRFIDEVRASTGLGSTGVAIIGHSIGGTVAFRLAAEAGDWPVIAVAISAIGDAVGPAMAGVGVERSAVRIDAPAGLDALLFDNGGHPLSWKPLASLRRATEPWLIPEVVEILDRWPLEWPEVAAGVSAPIHFRLAEHERLWETGKPVVNRMAAQLSGAPRIDAALLAGGGHLYEASKRGPELVAAQLDFIEAQVELS